MTFLFDVIGKQRKTTTTQGQFVAISEEATADILNNSDSVMFVNTPIRSHFGDVLINKPKNKPKIKLIMHHIRTCVIA